jgi:protein SCO1/2
MTKWRFRTVPALCALQALALGGGCANTPLDDRAERGRESTTARPGDSSAPLTSATASARPDAASEHCAQHQPLAAAAPLPGKSLYHLQASLTDQHGAELALGALRGQPVLVTMFYSSCTSICPMLIGQLQRIEAALDPAHRARTRVLLISLDPERDTVDRLAELARRHGVDDRRWSFTRTSEPSVREAAALLGIRYRRTDDGEISHSPVISLLDRDGVLVTRVEGALSDPGQIATAITQLAAAH